MEIKDTIVEAIRTLSQKGYPPSLPELAAAVGLKSTATVKYHLDRMRDDGLVTWVPHKNRTLRAVEKET